MDKTLGATNVVTEENLPLLWQEMLHPHLEDERRKGLDAVGKAKAEGKQQLEKAKEEIATVRMENERQTSSLGAELEEKRKEDRDAVEALCADVRRKLRRNKMGRILIAVSIALVSCIPLLVEVTPLVRTVSVFFGFLLAYVTATGGKLIGVPTGEAKALKALQWAAEERRLGGKLGQFDAGWNGSGFVILERPKVLPASDPTSLF